MSFPWGGFLQGLHLCQSFAFSSAADNTISHLLLPTQAHTHRHTNICMLVSADLNRADRCPQNSSTLIEVNVGDTPKVPGASGLVTVNWAERSLLEWYAPLFYLYRIYASKVPPSGNKQAPFPLLCDPSKPVLGRPRLRCM